MQGIPDSHPPHTATVPPFRPLTKPEKVSGIVMGSLLGWAKLCPAEKDLLWGVTNSKPIRPIPHATWHFYMP